jgi:hypothetical protein
VKTRRIRGVSACLQTPLAPGFACPKQRRLQGAVKPPAGLHMSGKLTMKTPIRLSAILLAACALGGDAAHAGDALPPPAVPADNAAMATLARMPSSRLRLGPLDIVLEETPLPVVRELLSTGAIVERGATAEHMSWLCYTYDSDGTRQRVWIISSSDFGEADHVADGVAAEIIEANDATPESCPGLPAGSPVWLDRKIWLGLTRDELVHRLGKPSQERGDILHFVYDSDVKLVSSHRGAADDYLVTSHLMVQLRQGRIVRLWASKTTSD